VTSQSIGKIGFVALALTTFVGLFPISARVADPLFTRPFRTGWQYKYPVLLMWSDHIQIRWFRDISEVSPRPKGESYTFNVSPEKQGWVEKMVRGTPSPNGNAAWVIHVKQLGRSKQQIRLELLGDGITGIVYDAYPEEVVPLWSRLAGPLGSLEILAVHLVIWGGFWLLLRYAIAAKRRVQPTVGTISRWVRFSSDGSEEFTKTRDTLPNPFLFATFPSAANPLNRGISQ
jgi:hypothetical protein